MKKPISWFFVLLLLLFVCGEVAADFTIRSIDVEGQVSASDDGALVESDSFSLSEADLVAGSLSAAIGSSAFDPSRGGSSMASASTAITLGEDRIAFSLSLDVTIISGRTSASGDTQGSLVFATDEPLFFDLSVTSDADVGGVSITNPEVGDGLVFGITSSPTATVDFSQRLNSFENAEGFFPPGEYEITLGSCCACSVPASEGGLQSLELVFVPVIPEPTAAGLLSLGVSLIGVRVRRAASRNNG